MEPVLTQEELEAIYEAMRTDATPSSSVDDYALTAGTEFTNKAKEVWTNAAKHMQPKMEGLIAGSLGKRVNVEVVPAEAMEIRREEDMDASEGGSSLNSYIQDENTIVNVIRFGEKSVLLEVDSGLAKRYIQRRTGAPAGPDDNGEASNKLTVLENRLLLDLVYDLANVISRELPFEAEAVLEKISTEDLFKKTPIDEAWFVIRFTVSRLSGSGVTLRGPLGLFMPRPEKSRDVIASRLTMANVYLSAELGRFQMTVSQLWHLVPGTVVPVETTVGDPLRVLIGGVPKLLGEPFVSRGNLAVRITNRMSGEKNERQ